MSGLSLGLLQHPLVGVPEVAKERWALKFLSNACELVWILRITCNYHFNPLWLCAEPLCAISNSLWIKQWPSNFSCSKFGSSISGDWDWRLHIMSSKFQLSCGHQTNSWPHQPCRGDSGNSQTGHRWVHALNRNQTFHCPDFSTVFLHLS